MSAVRTRPVLAAIYPVAALIILVPLVELAVGARPFQPTAMTWRFGVLGLLFKSLVTPLLGLALAMGVAVALDHRRVVRAFAVLNVLFAIGIAAAAVVFALDFLQLRTTVAASFQAGMDTASVVALAIAGLVAPAAAGLGIGGWIATKRNGPKPLATRSSKAREGLLVSQPTESAI